MVKQVKGNKRKMLEKALLGQLAIKMNVEPSTCKAEKAVQLAQIVQDMDKVRELAPTFDKDKE